MENLSILLVEYGQIMLNIFKSLCLQDIKGIKDALPTIYPDRLTWSKAMRAMNQHTAANQSWHGPHN